MDYFDTEMELREHHCLGKKMPLMAALSLDKIADDPLNAWIPQGTIFNESNVSLLCSLLRISFCLQTASPLLSREVA